MTNEVEGFAKKLKQLAKTRSEEVLKNRRLQRQKENRERVRRKLEAKPALDFLIGEMRPLFETINATYLNKNGEIELSDGGVDEQVPTLTLTWSEELDHSIYASIAVSQKKAIKIGGGNCIERAFRIDNKGWRGPVEKFILVLLKKAWTTLPNVSSSSYDP